VRIPATLGIVAGSNPNVPVLVRVIAIGNHKALILREATVQVPTNRTALLQLPLQWLSEGSALDKDPIDPTTDDLVEAKCKANQTAIAGSCQSDSVDVNALPTYEPGLVFGGGGPNGGGQCFDTLSCFPSAASAKVDVSDCSVAIPEKAGASKVNVALMPEDGAGICGAIGCFVPLDQNSADQNPIDGWTKKAGRILLPPGYCDRVKSGLHATVAVSTTCASKTSALPTCGAWSTQNGGGGSGGSTTGGSSTGGSSGTSGGLGGADAGDFDAGPPPNPVGTVILPNGKQGVAVVHIEDVSGNLVPAPQVASFVAESGPVLLVSEPSDFSQGLVLTTEGIETLDTATSSPQIVGPVVALPTSSGTPLSAAVIATSTFSVVQMSQLTDFFTTCFTTGLHLAQDQTMTVGPALAMAYDVSPDGTGMVAWEVSGAFDFYELSPTTQEHGENIDLTFAGGGAGQTPVPAVTGRGAMAWNAASDTVLAGGQDGSVTAFTGIKESPSMSSIVLPGAPAVASISYAPGGTYAVVATASGLFTVVVSTGGVPSVSAGPINPSYAWGGETYQLDHAQSVGISADGKYLVALTDQPTSTNGTLVVIPIDTSGDVGAVGLTLGGFVASLGVDALSVH
jgi:hypothetical protein